MGNCNCISGTEEKTNASFFDQPAKQENEVIENLITEVKLYNNEELAQALVRGYLMRKDFKKEKPSPKRTNQVVDIKNYLSGSMLKVLNDMDFNDLLVEGEVTILENGAFYIGEWENNKINGKGHMIQESTYYKGEFKEGIPNGKGFILQSNGNSYTGDFLNGKYHGFGTFNMKETNYSYKGDWVNGKQQGEGTEKWLDGASCKAQFVDGVKCGPGVFKWADGSLYKGSFNMNQIEGTGYYRWADGRKYTGE